MAPAKEGEEGADHCRWTSAIAFLWAERTERSQNETRVSFQLSGVRAA